MAAGREWPSTGGDHQEVMAALGLDLPAVLAAVAQARRGRPAAAGLVRACVR